MGELTKTKAKKAIISMKDGEIELKGTGSELIVGLSYLLRVYLNNFPAFMDAEILALLCCAVITASPERKFDRKQCEG